MVSKLDRIPSLARTPSLRESRESDDSSNAATSHSNPDLDPDLRVTLSAASLRLSEPTPPAPPGFEPPQATARSTTPPARSADAYREPHRAAVGGRLSIRI